MLIYVLYTTKNEIIILISVQYKQVGILVLAWLTMATVELGEVEGHFISRKKRVVIVRMCSSHVRRTGSF